jgi:carboxypeptidase Taq
MNSQKTVQETSIQFNQYLKETYSLSGINSLLGWDQQVNMPPGGAETRAKQIELVEVLLHKRSTSTELSELVKKLEQYSNLLDPDTSVNIRETKRSLIRQSKLNEKFVSEKSLACAKAYSNWIIARPTNDFKLVQHDLEKIVALSIQECDLVGYEESPYDALLDLYEPHARLSKVKPLLLSLAEELKELYPIILAKQKHNNSSFAYDENAQYSLCKDICSTIGFDFNNGRLDKSAHPFQSTIGFGDVRMTLRFHHDSFLPALYGALHEAGHALYEMGFKQENIGTPMGSPISLGIHESQSRFWENFIGRSKEFINSLFPTVKKYFPNQATKISPIDIWNEANQVSSSLIRVEADEVTYSLHIVIRMLLEEALIKKELAVKDLPTAWDELYMKYLGIKSPTYSDGVLQDIHWFGGSIGYFPTYALGNIYAAMFSKKMDTDLGGLYKTVTDGRFSEILSWLRKEIHEHGMKYKAEEIIKKSSGLEISSKYFVDYLKNKFLI